LLERFQLLEANDAESMAAEILGRIDTLALPASSDALAAEIAAYRAAVDDEIPVPNVSVQTVNSSPASWLEDDLFAA